MVYGTDCSGITKLATSHECKGSLQLAVPLTYMAALTLKSPCVCVCVCVFTVNTMTVSPSLSNSRAFVGSHVQFLHLGTRQVTLEPDMERVH